MNRNFRLLPIALGLALATPFAFANDPQTQAQANPETAKETGNDSQQPVTDTWITTKVKSTLLATDGVAGTDINVSTVDGVVTLAGVLDTQAAVDKAVEVTRGIEGVVSVDTRALKTR
jgi:hyperosmotically inducible protein